MESKALDKVLSCPTLPSLPGVAIKMLELMRRASCTADQIASVIQNDPALATKVLRTVNSSYYGLSQPCPTISRAVSLLGLNTVKSLTLGLSLVDMGRSAGPEFDLVSYWRRAVYGAAAARLIARLSKTCDPDEAFIAALLQDVGMLACYSALGVRYAAIVSSGAKDHNELPQVERDQLGFDHAEAGARMAEKWRLPDQIVSSTRYHHRPESTPDLHAPIVRVVAASTEAAAALTASEPQPRLVAFRRRMREWFNIDGLTSDDLLHQTGAAAKELSKLLDLDTGSAPDVESILDEAGEQLLHHQVNMEREQNELTRQSLTDSLTGAFNRKHFDQEMQKAFDEARTVSKPISVIFGDADKFKSVNDSLGHQAGDAVLIEVAKRIRDTVGTIGIVCRYGGEEFAVILPGSSQGGAQRVAEAVRAAIEKRPIDLSHLKLRIPEIRQTISMGVAGNEPEAPRYAGIDAMVRAADEAVYVAKRAGRNRVCVAIEPGTVSQEPPPEAMSRLQGRPLILIVEDDPLAAKMLEVLLDKHGQFLTRKAASAEDALRLLHGGRHEPPLRPDLVLVDMQLPAMSGLNFIRSCRSTPGLNDLKVVFVSSCTTPEQKSEAEALGAAACLEKADLCIDLAGSLKRLSSLARAA